MSLIDYSFLPKECNVIIMNSGGPDSALLVYKMAKFILENKDTHNIKVFHLSANTPLKNLYGHFAGKVIETIENKMQVNICEKHIIFDCEVSEELDETGHPVTLGYREAMLEQARILNKDYDCKFGISGFTLHFTSDMYDDPKYAQRRSRHRCPEFSQGREHFLNDTQCDILWYSPLAQTTKMSVVKEYDEYALENIFPVTRSCEAYPGQDKYVELGHCGKCLHCVERKMAFGKL